MSTLTRKPAFAALLLSATMLAGCATNKAPQFSYDTDVPSLPVVPAAVTDDRPRPLHTPPTWTVARGGTVATTPTGRVENANAAARVEPRREGYYNSIQIYPWSEGALYQVYAAPGQITTIALEPGESLTGAGPIAAGDTARWIIGDTESGSGTSRRVHILVKPTREDISTNLVISTDRRVYLIELRARVALYMPAVAWAYPALPAGQRVTVPAAPIIPVETARNYRYGLTGDTPPWRPISVFDDGRRVYVVFPRGIEQGEMPPIFVIGSAGETQIVNSRIHQNILIVDRLFGVAELRLGSGDRQQTVRIIRVEQRHAAPAREYRGGAVMSEETTTNAPPMRLRAEPPRVTRLSRKMLAGVGAVALLGIGGALIYALQTRDMNGSGEELYSTENRPTADGLAGLPRDYTGPVLGPALPGDLGGPILDAQNRGQPVTPSAMATPARDPAEERRLAEEEAARLSTVFFQSGQRIMTTPGSSVPGLAGLDLGGQPATQDRHTAFLNGPVDRQTVATDRIMAPASPYILQAGAVIPAAMITGIRSDLPGQITAQVTENVYDSPTGSLLLIPQGTRIIGQYDAGVQFGQRRVLLVWNRLILPNGRSIVLERQPGADASGYAGLEDGVD